MVRRAFAILLVIALLPACRRGDQRASGGVGGRQDAQPSANAASAPASPATASAKGAEVYAQHCAVCHMADGRGVPNLQPSLVGSPYLAGDVKKLENVIRGGSAVLAADRPNPVGNEMPPMGYLSTEEIQALIAYLKEQFGRAANGG